MVVFGSLMVCSWVSWTWLSRRVLERGGVLVVIFPQVLDVPSPRYVVSVQVCELKAVAPPPH